MLLGAGIAAVFLLDAPPAASSSGPNGTERVQIGKHEFQLELAADAEARALGLMNRPEISETGGMLFVFPDADVEVQRFWMGHCLTDMDIIFLDPSGRITAVHRMKVEPPQRPDETDAAYDSRMRRYSSIYPAQFAIEVRPGWLDKLDLKPGDRIALDLPRLKAMAR